jgi:hypothetical protein
MKYAPDFSRDLDVAYGLKPYTLKIEGQSDLTVPSVMEHPKRKVEAEPSAGQVIQQDREFTWAAHWTDNTIGPINPGAVLVDPRGVYWTLLSFSRIETTETITAHGRNLAVQSSTVNGVAINTVSILKAQFTKGRANEAKADWRGYVSGETTPTVADQVACRLQPSAEDAMIRFSGEWIKETFRATFARELPIELAQAEFRLLDALGGRYRIMHYASEQRLDALPVAIVVRIVDGFEYAAKPPLLPMP